MTESKYDVKDINDVVVFLCRTGSATSLSLADGKIDEKDIIHLGAPLMSLPAAIGGITNIPKQFKDMDAAEAATIHQTVVTELALDPSNANIESIVETVAGAALQLTAAIMAMVVAKQNAAKAVEAAATSGEVANPEAEAQEVSDAEKGDQASS